MQLRNLLIISTGLLILGSCAQPERVSISKEEYDALRDKVVSTEPVPQPFIPETGVDSEIYKMSVVTFDGHEYLVGRDSGPYNGGLFLTHKGGCKKCKEEMKEMIISAVKDALKENQQH